MCPFKWNPWFESTGWFCYILPNIFIIKSMFLLFANKKWMWRNQYKIFSVLIMNSIFCMWIKYLKSIQILQAFLRVKTFPFLWHEHMWCFFLSLQVHSNCVYCYLSCLFFQLNTDLWSFFEWSLPVTSLICWRLKQKSEIVDVLFSNQ